jgi:hypothetical protein
MVWIGGTVHPLAHAAGAVQSRNEFGLWHLFLADQNARVLARLKETAHDDGTCRQCVRSNSQTRRDVNDPFALSGGGVLNWRHGWGQKFDGSALLSKAFGIVMKWMGILVGAFTDSRFEVDERGST